jgi:5'-methylthioadenosine phosphorylase
MEPIGIISGTVPLKGKGIFKNLKKNHLNTAYGKACIFLSDTVAFIPRHGDNPDHYILPHMINHQANMKAMKDLGIKEVVGINSTGSLKPSWTPGMLLMPDDFIALQGTPTAVCERPVHITPVLSGDVRRKCLEAARDLKADVVDGGTYWQTAGPRFETKAEIRMMSHFADLVGMTLASEAIVAQEMELSYASICSVDNYAHGLVEKALSIQEIEYNARRNTDIIMEIVSRYIGRRK